MISQLVRVTAWDTLDQQIQKPIDPDQRQKPRPVTRDNLPTVSALGQKQTCAAQLAMYAKGYQQIFAYNRKCLFCPNGDSADVCSSHSVSPIYHFVAALIRPVRLAFTSVSWSSSVCFE